MIKTLLALATPLAMLTAPAVTALETEVAAAATIPPSSAPVMCGSCAASCA